VGIHSEDMFPVTFTPGFNASREADQTVFLYSDDPQFQIVTIKVTPQQAMDKFHVGLDTEDDNKVTAHIESYTINGQTYPATDEHDLVIMERNPTVGELYTYDVFIEVTPKVPAVEYMPHVRVGSGWPLTPQTAVSGNSLTYNIPELGTWTWKAQGSYNWTWSEWYRPLVSWRSISREDYLLASFRTEYTYTVPGDSFTNGEVTGNKEWDTNIINRLHATGEALTNVNLTLDSELVFDHFRTENLVTENPPPYEWLFPEIPVGHQENAGVALDSSEVTYTPGFDASRTIVSDNGDNTIFLQSDGTQTQDTKITVWPHEAMGGITMNVGTHDHPWVNAAIKSCRLEDSTDANAGDNFRFDLSPDGHHLSMRQKNPVVDAEYTYIVTAEVTPKVGKVQFKPFVGVSTSPSHPITSIGTTDSVSYEVAEIGTWTLSTQGSYPWGVVVPEPYRCVMFETLYKDLTYYTYWEYGTWQQYATYGNEFDYSGSQVTGYKFWQAGVDYHGQPKPDSGWEVTLDSNLDLVWNSMGQDIQIPEFEWVPGTYKWTFEQPNPAVLWVQPIEAVPVDFTPKFHASRTVDEMAFQQSKGTQNQRLTVSITPDVSYKWTLVFVAVEENDVFPIPIIPTRQIDENDWVDARIVSGPGGADIIAGGSLMFYQFENEGWPSQVGEEMTFDVGIEVTPNIAKVEFIPEVWIVAGYDPLGQGAYQGGTSHSLDVTALGNWTWNSDEVYAGDWTNGIYDSAAFIGYANIPPEAKVSVDPYLAPVYSNFTFDGSASQDEDGDVVSWEWDFGDGNVESGECIQHACDYAGLYKVTLTVTDDMGAQSTEKVIAVVYDPAAGFATGGGWFIPGGKTSYNDDYLPDIDGTSPANFGFVVKYKKGATNPDGQLEFRYQQGDFNLHSSGMEWLVITNKNWAKFQGLATIKINGLVSEELYPFHVDARDGDFGGRDQLDRFIIKVYAPDDVEQTDPIYKASGDLEGGNIVIHGEGYEVTTLRLESWFPSDHPLMQPLEDFASAVGQGTEGLVRIEVYPADSIVPVGELPYAVKWGDVDMGLMPNNSLVQSFSLPIMDGASLPFLYKNHDGLMAAVQAGVGDILSQELATQNITAIGWADFGMMQLFHKTKMLDEPGDIAGEQIRCMPGITKTAIESWGGDGINMRLAEVYGALESGVLTGVTTTLDIYYRLRLYDIAPYLCVDNAFGRLAVLGINSDVWNGLDENTQQIMTQAASNYVDEMLTLTKQLDADTLQWITNQGVNVYTLSPEEQAVWREASQSDWNDWVNEVGAVGETVIYDIALEQPENYLPQLP